MALVLKCTCGRLLDVDEQHHGERGQCPWCGNEFIVGEAINSTTVVQTEPTMSNLVRHESPNEKLGLSDDALFDPRIALPRPKHPLVRLLVIIGALGAGLALVLCFLGSSEDSDGKKGSARTTSKLLTNACETYSIKRARFPKSLEDLLNKDELGGPYVKGADYLVDPWGLPYQYDPAGPRNNGLVPDIWTVAPDGTEIGNWPMGR